MVPLLMRIVPQRPYGCLLRKIGEGLSISLDPTCPEKEAQEELIPVLSAM